MACLFIGNEPDVTPHRSNKQDDTAHGGKELVASVEMRVGGNGMLSL